MNYDPVDRREMSATFAPEKPNAISFVVTTKIIIFFGNVAVVNPTFQPPEHQFPIVGTRITFVQNEPHLQVQ